MKKRTTPRAPRRAGFTLIEIMVVMLIIGLMVSVVAPNVWNTFIRSQKGIARQQIHNLKGAVEMYSLNKHELPDDLEMLTEPDPETGKSWLPKVPLDPWGNEYVYQVDSDGTYEILSYGKDGQPGGEGENADISSKDEDQ